MSDWLGAFIGAAIYVAVLASIGGNLVEHYCAAVMVGATLGCLAMRGVLRLKRGFE
jgi:hypothetical protein